MAANARRKAGYLALQDALERFADRLEVALERIESLEKAVADQDARKAPGPAKVAKPAPPR